LIKREDTTQGASECLLVGFSSLKEQLENDLGLVADSCLEIYSASKHLE